MNKFAALSKDSIMQVFLESVGKVAPQYSKNFPETEVGLAFVKSENMIGGFIRTERDVDLENIHRTAGLI